MIDALQLLAALATGTLLGFAFFWGLWLTITGLERTGHPARRVLTSALLRFGVVLAGFLLLARIGGWQYLAAGAIGFTVSRFLVIRGTRARLPGSVNNESDA